MMRRISVELDAVANGLGKNETLPCQLFELEVALFEIFVEGHFELLHLKVFLKLWQVEVERN